MRAGFQGAIEREAAFCKRPVITYCDPKMRVLIDGKEITPPFLPHSRDPKTLAQIIDMVVESKDFSLLATRFSSGSEPVAIASTFSFLHIFTKVSSFII